MSESHEDKTTCCGGDCHTKTKLDQHRADRWHTLASTPAAVATLVEDDLEDEDWLRKPAD
jgi:hypothetical protein